MEALDSRASSLQDGDEVIPPWLTDDRWKIARVLSWCGLRAAWDGSTPSSGARVVVTNGKEIQHVLPGDLTRVPSRGPTRSPCGAVPEPTFYRR